MFCFIITNHQERYKVFVFKQKVKNYNHLKDKDLVLNMNDSVIQISDMAKLT